MNKYALGTLEESYQRFVNEIYDNKNVNALNGKEAFELCEKLQK